MAKEENRNRKAEKKTVEKQGKLTQIFDIPLSAKPGNSQIEISSNREAIVDGCEGVLEYEPHVVRLTTGSMIVKFCGRNLEIRVLTPDSAVIGGFITSIEFIT